MSNWRIYQMGNDDCFVVTDGRDLPANITCVEQFRLVSNIEGTLDAIGHMVIAARDAYQDITANGFATFYSRHLHPTWKRP